MHVESISNTKKVVQHKSEITISQTLLTFTQ